MYIVEDSLMERVKNEIFPISPPKILGANLDYMLSRPLKKVSYYHSNTSSSSNPTWPSDLVDFSQIQLLVCSSGRRQAVNGNGFEYVLYTPVLATPYDTLEGYYQCASIPFTSYTKVRIPGMTMRSSTSTNESTFMPLIQPATFLTEKKFYYEGSSGLYAYQYGLIPGGGHLYLWYRDNYSEKEEG